jgi:hypothetical protein
LCYRKERPRHTHGMELVPAHPWGDSPVFHVHMRGSKAQKAVRGWRACQGGNNLELSFIEYNVWTLQDVLPDTLAGTGDA